jgi:hypothetical protein
MFGRKTYNFHSLGRRKELLICHCIHRIILIHFPQIIEDDEIPIPALDFCFVSAGGSLMTRRQEKRLRARDAGKHIVLAQARSHSMMMQSNFVSNPITFGSSSEPPPGYFEVCPKSLTKY